MCAYGNRDAGQIVDLLRSPVLNLRYLTRRLECEGDLAGVVGQANSVRGQVDQLHMSPEKRVLDALLHGRSCGRVCVEHRASIAQRSLERFVVHAVVVARDPHDDQRNRLRRMSLLPPNERPPHPRRRATTPVDSLEAVAGRGYSGYQRIQALLGAHWSEPDSNASTIA